MDRRRYCPDCLSEVKPVRTDGEMYRCVNCEEFMYDTTVVNARERLILADKLTDRKMELLKR